MSRYVVSVLALVTVVSSFVTFVSVSTPAQEQAPAQEPAQPRPDLPRFRGGANLVRVDVYPTAKGVPVKDLCRKHGIGSATFRADIASMRHETQYTRLFRS